MKFLGIDYGRKKIGLAISDGKLAEPWKVIRIKNLEYGINNILDIVRSFEIQKVIIGISEGAMAEETKEFGKILEGKLKTPIIYQDESLSTYTAQELSMRAGIKRKKRKEMEDAYSASIILQSYLDTVQQL